MIRATLDAHPEMMDRVADAAAGASIITSVGISLTQVGEVAQILAHLGAALAGVGAFIYYLRHKRK
jgi:hypothetical protein